MGEVLDLACPAWEVIREHVERAAPEEACGILLGWREASRRVAVRAEPCRNVHPSDRRRHFLIDPERQLEVQRQARELGLEIIGYYHSHPEGAAEPSAEDRTQAHPWMVMLIVALRGGRAAERRAWLWKDGEMCELAFESAR